jgi:ketosteroid isomerase-like protein
MIEPQDRHEIRELTARYNLAFDGNDAEAWAGTFSDDGVFESSRGGTVSGRAALLDWFRSRPHDTIHATTDALVEGDQDAATQRCTVMVYERAGDTVRLRSVGYYTDRLVRGPEGWRFSYRSPITWKTAPEESPSSPAARTAGHR